MPTRIDAVSRVAAVLATSLATACAPASSPPHVSDTLELAVRADVTGIFPNPPAVNEAFTGEMSRNLYEPLVRLDGQMRLVPALARRWSNPAPDTYVFELGPELRFSDGSPVTAADVVASLQASQRWIYRESFHALGAVRALDPSRVEITTSVSFPVLLTRLHWGLVLPRSVLGLQPVPPIGSGPYRLVSREPGTEILLARNPHHAGPRPAFEHVRFHIIPDDDDRVDAVLSGEVDVADQVPLRRLPELAVRSGVRLVSQPGLRVLFLCLRLDRPPFDDPRVRESFDLAIDREQLVRRALDGHGEPASQIVPASIPGHDPSLPVTQRDPGRARALLAAAGYPNGLDVRLDGTNNRYVNDTAILAEVARQLGDVGVRVQVETYDKADLFARTAAGESDFWMIGWQCEAGDAGDALDTLGHSRTAVGYGDANEVVLADRVLDELIEHANASPNAIKRSARLRAAMQHITGLRAYLPLHVQYESVLLSRRVAWDPPLLVSLAPADMRPSDAAPR